MRHNSGWLKINLRRNIAVNLKNCSWYMNCFNNLHLKIFLSLLVTGGIDYKTHSSQVNTCLCYIPTRPPSRFVHTGSCQCEVYRAIKTILLKNLFAFSPARGSNVVYFGSHESTLNCIIYVKFIQKGILERSANLGGLLKAIKYELIDYTIISEQKTICKLKGNKIICNHG